METSRRSCNTSIRLPDRLAMSPAYLYIWGVHLNIYCGAAAMHWDRDGIVIIRLPADPMAFEEDISSMESKYKSYITSESLSISHFICYSFSKSSSTKKCAPSYTGWAAGIYHFLCNEFWGDVEGREDFMREIQNLSHHCRIISISWLIIKHMPDFSPDEIPPSSLVYSPSSVHSL